MASMFHLQPRTMIYSCSSGRPSLAPAKWTPQVRQQWFRSGSGMSSNTASPKLEMLASRCFEHVAGSDCSLELVANPSGSNYCPRLTAPKHPQNYVGFEVVVSLTRSTSDADRADPHWHPYAKLKLSPGYAGVM